MKGLEDHCFLDSMPTSSSVVFHPSRLKSGLLRVSKLLLVMILAARFKVKASTLGKLCIMIPLTQGYHSKE